MNSSYNVLLSIVDSLTNSLRFTEEIIKIIHDPESYFKQHSISEFDQLITEWNDNHRKYIDIHSFYTLMYVQWHMTYSEKGCPDRDEQLIETIKTIKDDLSGLKLFIEKFHVIQSVTSNENKDDRNYDLYRRLFKIFRSMTKSFTEKYNYIHSYIEAFKSDAIKYFEQVPEQDIEINDIIDEANNRLNDSSSS